MSLSTASIPAIIEIDHVDFAYGQQLVLKHVSLSVPAGSTVAVIGPNGGGKTTLLRLLLALRRPTRGTIRIDGLRPALAIARGDRVGYLPQNPSVPANFPLSVRQVAHLGLVGKTGWLRQPARGDLEFVDHLIGEVGLGEVADQPAGELSAGQRQRLFIARALASRPKLLLLDEPTTGIDRAGQERFVEFISTLKRELGLSLLFTSHDLPTVQALSDRIVHLNVTASEQANLPTGQVRSDSAPDLACAASSKAL